LCVPCMSSAHPPKALEKIQKYKFFFSKLEGVIFPEGERPLYTEVTLWNISKSQGGLLWGMHWRQRDCKIRYWRTGTAY